MHTMSPTLPILLHLVMLVAFSKGTEAAETMATVNARVPEASISEGLPVKFEVNVHNSTDLALHLDVYEASRLPETVLSIKLQSPFLKPTPPVRENDFGAPEFHLAPGEQSTIIGYLQTYLTQLPAGQYAIPFTIDWTCRALGPNTNQGTVHGAGMLAFRVTKADQTEIKDYISKRLAALQTSNRESASASARELSLVQDPSVIAAAETLIKCGFTKEGMDIASRFDSPVANRALRSVLTPSVNPVFAREAIAMLQQRGAGIGQAEIRGLLISTNSAAQLAGLQLVRASSDPSIQSAVEELLKSPNPEVRRAAQSAYDRLYSKEPRH
jgi:hypothetical protein